MQDAVEHPRQQFAADSRGTDVVLLKMPNHNMDYPHLATPTLTAALRRRFFRVVQKDVNVLLRDHLLTSDVMRELTRDYLPAIALETVETPSDFERIRNAVTYLRYIEDTLGFEKIEEVKRRMQQRDYDALFADEEDASIVSLLFVLTGLLHTIIDIGLIYEDADLDVRNPVVDFLDRTADEIAALNPALSDSPSSRSSGARP